MSLTPVIYRAVARAMFAPFGGLDALRQDALDLLALRPGSRVLELGCGPGDLTAQLVARGADVLAVDRSSDMLREASRKNPQARFTQADLLGYVPAEQHDVALLAFVLHELPVAEIRGVLECVATGLTSSGCIAVLDHATPAAASGSFWHRLLAVVETRAVAHWLAFDLPGALRAVGFASVSEHVLVGGRARLVIARRPANDGHLQPSANSNS